MAVDLVLFFVNLFNGYRYIEYICYKYINMCTYTQVLQHLLLLCYLLLLEIMFLC